MACSGVGEASIPLIKGEHFLPRDVFLEVISYLFQWHVKGMRCVCVFWKEQIPLKKGSVKRAYAWLHADSKTFSVDGRLGSCLGKSLSLYRMPSDKNGYKKDADFTQPTKDDLNLQRRCFFLAQDQTRKKVCCFLDNSCLQFSSYTAQDGWETSSPISLNFSMRVTALALQFPYIVVGFEKGMIDIYSEEKGHKKLGSSKEHGEEVRFLSFFQQKYIVSTSDHQIKVWGIQGKEALREQQEAVIVALVAGNYIYTADSTSLKMRNDEGENSYQISVCSSITCMEFGDDCLITGHISGEVHFRNRYIGISFSSYSFSLPFLPYSPSISSLFFASVGHLYVVAKNGNNCLFVDVLICF